MSADRRPETPPERECGDQRCEHCPPRTYWELYVTPLLRRLNGTSLESAALVVIGLGETRHDDIEPLVSGRPPLVALPPA